MHEILLPSSRTSRFLNSRRHPDQAAIVARLPLLGRRVPMRSYWRHQPISLSRIASHASRDVADAARDAGFGAKMGVRGIRARRGVRHARQTVTGSMPATMHDGRHAGMRRRDRLAETWSHRPRLGVPMLIAGTAAGAFFMFMLDPREGRRRRALVRDRIVHMRRVMMRDVPTRVEKRGRFFRGVARGIVHETTDVLPFNGHGVVDNETLVARVRSEVLRDDHIKAGEINLDAYEGCVTLRGQLEHPDAIRRLVNETAHVDGVREVRNYLHLPGTPPPNMASVYTRHGPVPQHLRQ
jgi:hypothetical protein